MAGPHRVRVVRSLCENKKIYRSERVRVALHAHQEGLDSFRLSRQPGGRTCVGWVETAKAKGEKRNPAILLKSSHFTESFTQRGELCSRVIVVEFAPPLLPPSLGLQALQPTATSTISTVSEKLLALLLWSGGQHMREGLLQSRAGALLVCKLSTPAWSGWSLSLPPGRIDR